MVIYKTRLSGEFGRTNIIIGPLVTAVTTMAMDHDRLLGPTNPRYCLV